MQIDKRFLPQAKDRISCVYVEKARIEQTEYAIQIIRNGTDIIELPISNAAALFLGPGATITHRAVQNITEVGCSVVWCGQNAWRFYAGGEPGTKSSKNILTQMQYHESKMKHSQVVRKMYQMRYPDERLKSKSIQELQGMEGVHVQRLYQMLASQYHIEWTGRQSQCVESQDLVNKCLTYNNQILYGVIRSVLHMMGYSTAIGFIHTGHMNSFVFDIADLYKEQTSIPVAFAYCSKNNDFNAANLFQKMRGAMDDIKIMQQIPKDLKILFGDADNNTEADSCEWWSV